MEQAESSRAELRAIAAEIGALQDRAQRQGVMTLAYLLDMARLEAEHLARSGEKR